MQYLQGAFSFDIGLGVGGDFMRIKVLLTGNNKALINEFFIHTCNQLENMSSSGIEEDILCHYGMPRRSGRYPWGSGEDPFQHTPDFYNRVREYEKQGLSEQEICQIEGVNSKELRIVKSIGKDRIRADKISYA